MSREVVGSVGRPSSPGEADVRPAPDARRRPGTGGELVSATSLDSTGHVWRGPPGPPSRTRGVPDPRDAGDREEPDAADDGSGADDAPPTRPPAGGGPLSGRRGLVVLVVVAALVGALVGAGVVQRSQLRTAQSTAAVQAWVALAPGRGSADAIALTLHVVNTGAAPVRVEGIAMNGGLDRPGPVSVVLDEPGVVQPGTMASLDVDAQSSCEGTPLASDSSTDGRLQLRLRTDDGREGLVDPPTGGISLTSADVQEQFCGQTGTRLGLTVSAMQPRPGGELSMSLLNDSPEALTLEFSGPTGTRVVSDTALPMTIRSGTRASVVIRLEVDLCTNDARRLQAGDDEQLVIDGRARRGGLDGELVAAWVAQEVAQQC